MALLKILSVDDEPTNQSVIEEIMEDLYNVKLVYSGEECLEVVEEFNPDLILLDISMPGINGYETCEKLKQNKKTQYIPVIILSALSTAEERLKGYESGAEDYIPKPFEHSELLGKISATLDYHQHNKANPEAIEHVNKLEQELQASREIAFDAMRYTGDLGMVIKFYEDSGKCKTYNELAEILFSATRDMDLKCSLQFRTRDETLNLSSDGRVSPMEAGVFDAAKLKGRFFDFNARTMVNYAHVSLLVKNMPLEDDNKYGILKDILGALGNGLEQRTKVIMLDMAIEKNRTNVIELIQNTFKEITRKHVMRSRENTELLERMVKDMNITISELDLMEYQEDKITSIMESFRQSNDLVVSKGLDLQDAAAEAYTSLTESFNMLAVNE